MTSEQLKELREIRAGFLLGVTGKDLLYIKMQINKLDTIIYKASENIKTVPNDCCMVCMFWRYTNGKQGECTKQSNCIYVDEGYCCKYFIDGDYSKIKV